METLPRGVIPRQRPDRPGRLAYPDASRTAATRWLCAAVTLDPVLEHRILDQILEEQQRAVITTPGVDLVTVLKYALAAQRRRLISDAVLVADLVLLVITVLFIRSALLFLALLVLAWVTVFAERFASQFGSAISGLRPGAFDPGKVHAPPPNSFEGQQLRRVGDSGTSGNVTFYSGFSPFRGYGTARSSWSFAVDVTRPDERKKAPGTFTALEVYDHVKAGLLTLDLSGLELTDRLFVNGRDIHGDSRFLPADGGPPVTSVHPELIRQLLAQPEEWARPYLTISRTGWQGDLVMTTFIRFLVSGSDLFVEAAHSVVPPLRAEFKAIDEREPGQETGAIVRLAGRTLISTIPRILGSIAGIFRELGSDSRRRKKLRRVRETRDYGALASVRELAADTKWQRYFQIFDDERFVKVVEQRIFHSLVQFLKDNNIDSSTLQSRADMLINNGVIFGDNANIKDGQVAGAGSRLAGFMQRTAERNE